VVVLLKMVLKDSKMMVLVMFGALLLILTGVIFQGKERILMAGSHTEAKNIIPLITLG